MIPGNLPLETLDPFHFVLCRKLSLTEPKSIRPFAILNCIDTPRLLEWSGPPPSLHPTTRWLQRLAVALLRLSN